VRKATIIGMLLMLGVSSALFAIDNVKFSGQLRHRYEMSNKDFDATNDASNTSYLRSRFNAVFQPSYDVKAMLQIQNTKTLGSNSGTLAYADDDRLFFHQGYVQLTDLFFNNFDFKLGRYEVAYGPQRLIGAVGWHNIARSFDGFTATYHHSFADVDLFHLQINEDENDTEEPVDTVDTYLTGIYTNFKFDDYTAQAFYYTDKVGANNRNTFGVYAKGKIFGGLSHETEFAMQTVDTLTANMYAVNLTYKLGDYKISAGYDHLSGADGDKQGAFFNSYATNHKYYGYMDYFLANPTNGLNDMHFKLSGLSFKGINMKLAYHIFNTDTPYEIFADSKPIINDDGTESGNFYDAFNSTDLGSEIDLTFVKKYNDNVKFVAGYSTFTAGEVFSHDLWKGDKSKTADWFYLMTIINF
jgi:hypothetical protein